MRSARNVISLIATVIAVGAISATGASAASLNAIVDTDPDPYNLFPCFSYPFEADRPGETEIDPANVGPLDCSLAEGMADFEGSFVVDFQTDGTGSISPSSGNFRINVGGFICTITVRVPVPITEQPYGIFGESWLGTIEVKNSAGEVTSSGLFCPTPQPYDLKLGFFVND